MTAQAIEALTVGRIGVDLYPQQSGVPLPQVSSFARSLGGTATNVAVGVARLGHRAGVLTKVGADAFADFARHALDEFGVDSTWVGTAPELLTPIVFCALDPSDDPPLLFYRRPIAPDLTISESDVPWPVVEQVPLLWLTGTGFSTEPSRTAHVEMLRRRRQCAASTARWTLLDIDWRSTFWPSQSAARRELLAVIGDVNVVVGNRAEVSVVLGTENPHEATRMLLDRGVELAVVKLGSDGVLVATPADTVLVPPVEVRVANGLGAGDAFGAALVHGLLSGWDVHRCAVYANAAGAIVASRLACAAAMPTASELDAAVAASILEGSSR